MFFRLLLAEIGERHLQLVAHLPVRVFRKANAARLADRLQPRRDVDAVAHEVAVALLDDVAEMDADADLDALVSGNAGVALGEPASAPRWRERTASTTLRNSTTAPSPVRLTMRPLWIAIVGSIRSLRSVLRRASVRSSSAPASRL